MGPEVGLILLVFALVIFSCIFYMRKWANLRLLPLALRSLAVTATIGPGVWFGHSGVGFLPFPLALLVQITDKPAQILWSIAFLGIVTGIVLAFGLALGFAQRQFSNNRNDTRSESDE